MSNIATTDFKIQSVTSEPVQKIYKAIQKLDDNKRWNIGLADLADEFGINCQERNISARGSVYYYDLDEQSNVLTISTESAWTSPVELFDAIAEQFGEDDISVSFMGVEVGCEYFVIRDCGDFFDYDCLVTYSGEPFGDGAEEPYETISQAIDFWCEKVSICRDGRSDEEMLELINGFEYPEGDDCYFYIYKFEFE